MHQSNKIRLKNLLDFPLIILVIYISILLFEFITRSYGLQWQHLVAFIMLPINIGLFFWYHQVAVLALGLTLILGLVGVLAVTSSITITTFSIGQVPVFYGQLIFLVFFLIHLLVSGRYYFGIGTTKYWQVLFNDKNKQARSRQ